MKQTIFVALIFLFPGGCGYGQSAHYKQAFAFSAGLVSAGKEAPALRLEYEAQKIPNLSRSPVSLNYFLSGELLNLPVLVAAFHARFDLLNKISLFNRPAVLSGGLRADLVSGQGSEWNGIAMLRQVLWGRQSSRVEMQNGLIFSRLYAQKAYDFLSGYTQIVYMCTLPATQQLQTGLLYKRAYYTPGNFFAHNFGLFLGYQKNGPLLLRARISYQQLKFDAYAQADKGMFLNVSFGRFIMKNVSLFFYGDIYLPLNNAAKGLPSAELSLLRRNRYGLKILFLTKHDGALFITLAYRQLDIRGNSAQLNNSLFILAGYRVYMD